MTRDCDWCNKPLPKYSHPRKTRHGEQEDRTSCAYQHFKKVAREFYHKSKLKKGEVDKFKREFTLDEKQAMSSGYV